MRKNPVVPTEECPCGGAKGPWWHRSHGLNMCEYAWTIRKIQRGSNANAPSRQPKANPQLGVPRWRDGTVVGSSIFVDEEEVMA